MKKFLNKWSLAILGIAMFMPLLGAGPAIAAGIGIKCMIDVTKKHIDFSALELMTVGDLTFSGEEVKDLAECVMEEAFKTPAIGDFHTIDVGIVTTKQIALLGRLGMVGTSGQGCDPDEDELNIPRSEKYWEPASVSTRVVACYKDSSLLASFFVYGLGKGIAKADLTKTDFFNFVKELLVVELKEAAFRIAWFAKKTAATTTDSPPGLLKAGTKVSFFNHITGLWEQIYTIVAGDATKRITITKNAGATYVLQAFTPTDTTNMVVTGYFQEALYSADYRLRDRTDLVFVATQSMADQYSRELKKANQAFTTERLENGITVLKSDGIEIYAFNLWDRIIRTYFNNGTVWYQPHRFVLTTKTNLRIGLEEEAAITGMDVFFDKPSKKSYIDSEFTMDAKLIENYKFMAGY